MPTGIPSAPKEIFHVHVEDAGPGTFSVYAEGETAEAVQVNFLPDDSFKELMLRLQGRSPVQYIDQADQEIDTTLMGERLFSTFFVDPVLKRYFDYRKRIGFADPRIALNLPRSLYYLPWELLRDPSDVSGQFLAMQGSVIRFDESTRPTDTLYGDRPSSTFMFLLASTDQEPLGPFEVKNTKHLKFYQIKPASYPRFQSHLKKVQPLGLVFFGHGRIENENGYLVFADQISRFPIRRDIVPDPRPAYGIGNELGALKTMKLAYFLACESSWIGNEFPFDRTITGSILIRTKIAFVIGAQTKINFFAAREFFYRTVEALIEGQPLDLAVTVGRNAIFVMNPIKNPFSWRDWWVPVIYARTTDFDVLQNSPTLALPEQTVKSESPVAVLQSGPAVTVESAQFLGAVGRSFNKLFSSDNEASRGLL
jgi:hypothetical protein